MLWTISEKSGVFPWKFSHRREIQPPIPLQTLHGACQNQNSGRTGLECWVQKAVPKDTVKDISWQDRDATGLFKRLDAEGQTDVKRLRHTEDGEREHEEKSTEYTGALGVSQQEVLQAHCRQRIQLQLCRLQWKDLLWSAKVVWRGAASQEILP